MMSDQQVMVAIAIMAVVTAAIRFAPFVIFNGRKTPQVVTYLGKCLPFAVIGMLVVYCLKDMEFTSIGGFLPALIAGAVVAGSYLLKRSALLSIVLGTACYMVLVQVVFV